MMRLDKPPPANSHGREKTGRSCDRRVAVDLDGDAATVIE
jgi:hypothetical protein